MATRQEASMEYEQRKQGRVRHPEPLLPVPTPAQQAHQRKVFQGYAQEQEAAPTREQERQRLALPGQLQAFTRLDQSGPVHVQRQQQWVAPVLQAAELRRQDDLAVQRTQDELSTVQRNMQASGKTLSAYGLAPAGPLDVIQLQREEDRQAARAPVAPLPLSPVQRQALMQHATDEIGSALTRDARYLPAAGRADVAHAAVQRYAQQGLDREALRSVMVQRAPDENTRESVTQLLTAQRRQEMQAQEDKEERDLLLSHHGLQRRMQDAQAEHDGQHAQSLSERVQARQGTGQPLPTEVRRQLELGLNADLSRVRIHDDTEADKLAKSIQAVAFTSGRDIFFRAGKYQPNTQTGFALLMHEGTHTVQQARGQAKPGIDADAGLEQEAVANEGRAGMSATPVPETSASKTTSSGHNAAGQAVQRLADPTPTTHFWFGPNWTRTFSGTIDGHPITMTLTRAGNAITGHYGYVGNKGQLILTGQVNPDTGMATVTERDPKGAGSGTPPVFVLAPNTALQLLGGWTNDKGELPVQLDTTPQTPPQHAPGNTASIDPPPGYVPLLPAVQKGSDLTEKSLASLRTLIAAQLVQWKIEAPPAGSKQSVMALSAQGLADIKSYEGEGKNVYNDSAGLPTIGFGHLLDSNHDHKVSSKEWAAYDALGYPRKDLTEAQEQELLVKDVTPYVDAMNEALSVPVTQGMFDAFVCFLFNTGSPTAAAFLRTNIANMVNAGKYAEVPAAMYKWIHVTINKKLVPQKGLQNRRLREITQFATPHVAPK